MSYPTIDPHPAGPLLSTDETFTQTTLFATIGQISELRSRHYNTSVCAFGNYVYFVYIDTAYRPKIVKAAIDGSGYTEAYLDNGADYTIRLDDHHTFSIVVDRYGYIHVVGDMHNHRPGVAPDSEYVTRYRNSLIMYWVSDQPENITAFTFQGNTSARCPQGYSYSYPQFHRDINGTVYFKARIYVHAGGHYEGETGLGVYRYSEASQSWTALGGLAPTTHGNEAIYKSVFWEDNGEWWQSQPVDHTRSFYQGVYNGLRFDLENNIHFCFPINNITDNKNSTEVIYWKSTDGGDTFQKADGTTITAPVRASGSANVGDIVGANGRYTDDAWVDVDWGGRQVVAYNWYTDQSSVSPNSPPRTRIYRGGVFESSVNMQLNRVYGSGVGSGNDGILMYWAFNNSTTQADIYRTRRYGETGYSRNIGGEMSGFDWITYKRFGRLFLCVNDGVNMELQVLTFTDLITDDPGAIGPGSTSINKKMIMSC